MCVACNHYEKMHYEIWILIFILLFAFINNKISAQVCEDYDKSLFHMLPDTFPNKINCIDSIGLKQGWWINYTLKHYAILKPDELGKGNYYVESYSYGKYKNNIKIGDWILVANTQSIYVTRKENYYYAEDTIMVTVKSGQKKSTLYFNADSSIIKSISLSSGENFPICIECNKYSTTGKECTMTYRNENIKEFSFDHFDIEYDNSFYSYDRDKKIISNILDK